MKVNNVVHSPEEENTMPIDLLHVLLFAQRTLTLSPERATRCFDNYSERLRCFHNG